jgi:hypothetical protein
MFERENTFYTAHQAEFQEKYFDKQLVIVGESLWGVYDTMKEAAQNALKHFEPGEFMIHTPAHDGMVIEIGPNIDVRYPDDAERPEPNAVMTYTGDDIMAFPHA